MATVYVVTAGSGDGYRIERVYLDSDQAYGFAQAYNGISPVEPVQVEEWQDGAPAGVSKDKVEELFWDTVTQVRAELAGVPRK
jgi:hypothetical protein